MQNGYSSMHGEIARARQCCVRVLTGLEALFPPSESPGRTMTFKRRELLLALSSTCAHPMHDLVCLIVVLGRINRPSSPDKHMPKESSKQSVQTN